MGKKSIPNCRRANFPTSTRSSKRSRRSCDGGMRGWGARECHVPLQGETSNTERATPNIQQAPDRRDGGASRFIGCSMFDVQSVSSSESDGCLVALAVFKTVVGPFNGSRYVRFVPSPPVFTAIL